MHCLLEQELRKCHALMQMRPLNERNLQGLPIENDLIHQFHGGPSRDVWRKYATNRLQPVLWFAVATGILRKEELPAELLQHLAGLINFYEAEQSA